MQKSIASVSIKFTDGSSRVIIVDPDDMTHEGFYKEESLDTLNIIDHTVYIVNGFVRDTPVLNIEGF